MPKNATTHEMLLKKAKQSITNWMSATAQLKTVHYLASERINEWLIKDDFNGPLITSIGRLTD